MLPQSVQTKLDNLPAKPGVYLFFAKDGAVLYVGKAGNLRNRVRSYFQASGTDDRHFIAGLRNELGDLETVVVSTEKEAALLENTLIKEHRPRYNVKLRDDKEYLSLKLDPNAAWPRLEVVRRPKEDGALYFGPYHSATAARQTLRLVNRHFQLRTCTDTEMKMRVRPCLQHQIKRCPAPCVLDVDRTEYGVQVKHVGMFLSGKHDELLKQLSGDMKSAAQALEYERAAVLRDQIRAVEQVRERQHVTSMKRVDQDVLGVYREADQAEVVVMQVREGKLVAVQTYELSSMALPDEELVGSFLSAYYTEGSFVPDEVLLPFDIEVMQGLADVLGERRGAKVKVFAPKRGVPVALVRMAAENAVHAYNEKARARDDVERRLAELMRRLKLPKLPRRIECVDISHTAGTDTVGAIVALRDGAIDRAKYRGFNVRSAKAGDDYGAMYEVLARRFRRGRTADAGWELPDLLVVDGGKGQLGVALAVTRDLGVTEVPIVALAKEKENTLGEKLVDRVYLPGQKNPIALRENSAALYLLALARDEAHRVSNRLREARNKRRSFASSLDAIDGVGAKTRAKLLRNLGSVRSVAEATVEKLVEAGAKRSQAEAIYSALHRGGDVGSLVEQAPPSDPSPPTEEALEDAAVENAFT